MKLFKNIKAWFTKKEKIENQDLDCELKIGIKNNQLHCTMYVKDGYEEDFGILIGGLLSGQLAAFVTTKAIEQLGNEKTMIVVENAVLFANTGEIDTIDKNEVENTSVVLPSEAFKNDSP